MKRRVINKIVVSVLIVLCFSGMVVSVNAADQNFEFYLTNTGTSFWTYPNTSNTKTYANNDGTIRTKLNEAPGYGMLCHLSYKNSSNQYCQATENKWFSHSQLKHPAYLDGQNQTNRPYYVSGRIDNDYYGHYTCNGKFNADYTNPTFP